MPRRSFLLLLLAGCAGTASGVDAGPGEVAKETTPRLDLLVVIDESRAACRLRSRLAGSLPAAVGRLRASYDVRLAVTATSVCRPAPPTP
jgi:hypothetical protein